MIPHFDQVSKTANGQIQLYSPKNVIFGNSGAFDTHWSPNEVFSKIGERHFLTYLKLQLQNFR